MKSKNQEDKTIITKGHMPDIPLNIIFFCEPLPSFAAIISLFTIIVVQLYLH